MGNKKCRFFVLKPKPNAMSSEKKKNQTKEERHADRMRARYAALMMGHYASNDLQDEEDNEDKGNP